jgi:hypothetical protein
MHAAPALARHAGKVHFCPSSGESNSAWARGGKVASVSLKAPQKWYFGTLKGF